MRGPLSSILSRCCFTSLAFIAVFRALPGEKSKKIVEKSKLSKNRKKLSKIRNCRKIEKNCRKIQLYLITAPFPKNPQSPVPYRRPLPVPYRHPLPVTYNAPPCIFKA